MAKETQKGSFTGMRRWGLRELNSSYIRGMPQELSLNKRPRLVNIFITIIILYIIVVLGYYPTLKVMGLYGAGNTIDSLGFVLVVFGAVSIYYGLKVYFYYLAVRNTPFSSIGASSRLSELKVRFVPESDAALVAPASNQKCVYFKLEEHEVTSAGEHGDAVIASATKAIPALLADDTGYLAVDFTSVALVTVSERYKPVFSEGVKSKFQSAMDRSKNDLLSMENMPASTYEEMYDIWQKGQDANLRTMQGGVRFVKGDGYGSIPQPPGAVAGLPDRRVYFVEYILPLDQEYFALGEVRDLDKTLNRKPVKLLHADPNYKLFSLLPESKKVWAQKDTKTFIALFAFGFINIIIGLTLVAGYLAYLL